MKRLIAVLLVLLISVSCFAACSKGEGESATEAENENQATVNEEELKPLEVKDSGYTVYKEKKLCKICFGVEVKNPNKDYVARFPTLTVTSKDKSGKALDTQSLVISPLGAGETVKFGQIIQYEGEKPEKVEFKIENPVQFYVVSDDAQYPPSDMFKIENKAEASLGDNYAFRGEVTNNSSKALNSIAVSVVIYKDKKIVGGATGYTEAVSPTKTTQFEINFIPKTIAYDSYDLSAFPWGAY